MENQSKDHLKMKVFAKGQIVIPVSLRRKYHIEVGDHIDVIPRSDGILLKSVSHKDRIDSLTDQLFGIFRSYKLQKDDLSKRNITRATEKELLKGWKK